jgi:hypothetical protein
MIVSKKNVVSLFWVMALAFWIVPQAGAFELNGFTDVTFSKCTDPCALEEGRNGGFAFGSLDFYLARQEGNLDILVELVVEEGAILDLERLTLGYTFSDALRLRVGRFHTPLGFWNTSYHHGVILQPTVQRPEFLVFEDDGGVLPIHNVGVYLSGRVKSSWMATEYGVMVANGAYITSEDGASNLIMPGNTFDNSQGKAVAFNLAVTPSALPALKIGVSGHMSRVQDDDSAVLPDSVDVDQTILNGSVMYMGDALGLMGEYYAITDEDNIGGAGSKTSNAYYALVTYTIAERWIPYVLYENMDIQEADPYFISLGSSDVTKTHGGLRYNITYKSTVKAEFTRVEWGDEDWNSYAVQWSLAF